MMRLGHIGNGLALGTGNGDWGEMAKVMREMMWPYQTGLGRTFWGIHWIFELVTWVLIIALLATLVRWVWRKGDKV